MCQRSILLKKLKISYCLLFFLQTSMYLCHSLRCRAWASRLCRMRDSPKANPIERKDLAFTLRSTDVLAAVCFSLNNHLLRASFLHPKSVVFISPLLSSMPPDGDSLMVLDIWQRSGMGASRDGARAAPSCGSNGEDCSIEGTINFGSCIHSRRCCIRTWS